MNYRFALRPRWVVLHMLVLIAVPMFAVAGFWQLRRLDERRERNALISERSSRAPRSLDDVLADGDATYRRVRAVGTFDASEEVVLVGRGRDGVEGNHVLTPLRIDREDAILVDRGWVPPQLDDPPVRQALPPDEEVTVTGVLLRSEGRGPFGGGGRARSDVVTRIDVARVATGSDHRFLTTDLYLLLQDQEPSPDDLPRPVPLDELSEGSHRIYAVQWFLFIPTLLAVYVLLLRREGQRSRETERV